MQDGWVLFTSNMKMVYGNNFFNFINCEIKNRVVFPVIDEENTSVAKNIAVFFIPNFLLYSALRGSPYSNTLKNRRIFQITQEDSTKLFPNSNDPVRDMVDNACVSVDSIKIHREVSWNDFINIILKDQQNKLENDQDKYQESDVVSEPCRNLIIADLDQT